MTRYLVTRYAATRAFADHLSLAPFIAIEQADPAFLARLVPGDEVYGTLPVDIAAQVCAGGALFHALILPATREERGQQRSLDEMIAAGACFRRYEVALKTISPRPSPVRARWRLVSIPFLTIFGLITGIVLAQNVVANFVYDLLKLAHAAPSAARDDDLRFYLAGGVIALGCLGALLAVAWHLRHRVVRSRVAQQRPPKPCRTLVIGLSDINRGKGGRAVNLQRIAALGTLPFSVAALSAAEFEAAKPSLTAEQIAGYALVSELSWQQALRAIRAHILRLREVLVISSAESAADFALFLAMAVPLLSAEGHNVTIRHLTPEGVDFEEFQTVYETMRSALARAPIDEEGQDDVCVDVTAGLKVFSIAGAVATLNRGVAFGYVNHQGEVQSYDAFIEVGAVGA